MKTYTIAILSLATLASTSHAAVTTLLSDSFSRANPGTPVGSAPIKDTSAGAQAAAATGWVSSWGANDNSGGGTITQTYTTYNDAGKSYKVDGTNAISGNWLNNGVSLLNNAGSARVSEPIGIPGFAWTQINHNFANNPTVQTAERLRVGFDLYRPNGGNLSWFMGQDDSSGVANGNAGSPATVAANDISLYFRGTQAATYGLRDNGLLPAAVTGIANYDTISYASTSPTYPMSILIDIIGTNFSAGATSVIELSVNGVIQDLNGSAVAGNGYTFTWDAGGAAYMGFASNNSPVGGTVALPDPRAAGIDNLVITAVPEPMSLGLIAGMALLGKRRRH